MASWKSNSLKVSLLVCDGPPFPYFSLIGFDSTTDDLDHPLAAKQADPPHAARGSFAVVGAEIINAVLAKVLFDDCHIALLDGRLSMGSHYLTRFAVIFPMPIVTGHPHEFWLL
jgi:hypothetical protein